MKNGIPTLLKMQVRCTMVYMRYAFLLSGIATLILFIGAVYAFTH